MCPQFGQTVPTEKGETWLSAEVIKALCALSDDGGVRRTGSE